ncbi:UdgX family uracil-DNA binding protein [Parvularcula dongshanensis]|uniref:Type-4 uracil-DNA glycosylase n=1 Tax=Parvularcula dongshanensis TaxID=1173995 RepID=A0A840HZH8_9PROT|nr:DNA polymerase [Parvularcula dongshanensis]
MADLFSRAVGNADAVLDALREEAAGCTLCPLYEPATQTVFGEGRAAAQIMLVGEQPGDQEDLAGEPFVGPAGQVLDECLDRAGIDRSNAYVTNAVKHFKFVQRGRRRIHEKPKVSEIDVCAKAWLAREREVVAPDLVIALGASAVRGITGKSGTIKSMRSDIRPIEGGSHLLVTVHPSYLLRIPDDEMREAETAAFVDDLRMGREFVAGLS